MTFQDYFPATVAIDPDTGTVVQSATAQVYAMTDTAFATPLAITDLVDVPIPNLRASATAVYPAFKVPGHTQILVKSGDAVTPMLSVYAMIVEAGLDPSTVASAIAAAAAANASKDAAETAAAAAAAAQGAAEEAQAGAEAVPTSNDGIVAGLVADSGSSTRGELDAAIAEVAAEEIANPETPANSAVVDIVNTALGGGVSGLVRVETGTLDDITTARPTWAGVVEWWVNEGDGTPTNIAVGDLIVEVVSSPLPDVLIASDDFTRADGALGSTTVGAKAWTVAPASGGDATFGVVSNQAKVTGGTTGRAVAYIDTGYERTRYLITLFSSVNRQAGVAFRIIDENNMYVLARVSSSDNHYRLVKYTAGSAGSTLKTFAASITAGDEIEIDDRLIGNLKIYVNSVLEYDEAVDGALSYSTATKVGLNVTSVAASTGGVASIWDNLYVYREA